MNTEKQQNLIAYLLRAGNASPREISRALALASPVTHHLLEYVLARGRIVRTGSPRRWRYSLATDWQEKICTPKSAPRQRTRPVSAVQVCRQNWSGYQVHKIFGSGRISPDARS